MYWPKLHSPLFTCVVTYFSFSFCLFFLVWLLETEAAITERHQLHLHSAESEKKCICWSLWLVWNRGLRKGSKRERVGVRGVGWLGKELERGKEKALNSAGPTQRLWTTIWTSWPEIFLFFLFLQYYYSKERTKRRQGGSLTANLLSMSSAGNMRSAEYTAQRQAVALQPRTPINLSQSQRTYTSPSFLKSPQTHSY